MQPDGVDGGTPTIWMRSKALRRVFRCPSFRPKRPVSIRQRARRWNSNARRRLQPCPSGFSISRRRRAAPVSGHMLDGFCPGNAGLSRAVATWRRGRETGPFRVTMTRMHVSPDLAGSTHSFGEIDHRTFENAAAIGATQRIFIKAFRMGHHADDAPGCVRNTCNIAL